MRSMDLIGAERPLEEIRTRVAALPSLWRRRAGFDSLETLPGGIRLAVFTSPFIVRWATWLIALLVVLVADLPSHNTRFEPWLLAGTFIQIVLLTFYVPLIRPWLLPKLRRYTANPEQYDVLAAGLADLALSMTAVYLSGGWGSPYFHFALTALLIPTFFLSFRAVIVLGVAYMGAYVLALSTAGEGLNGNWTDRNVNSFIGALVTPLLVALVPNYLGNLLRELDAARQDAVDALSDSDLQFRVARAFLEPAEVAGDTLARVAEAALEASRFDELALLVHDERGDVRAFGLELAAPLRTETMQAAFSISGARTVAAKVLPPPLDQAFAGCGWTASVALRSQEAVEGWLIVGTGERPVSVFHEVRLLDALAGQIALGVRNLRLAARVAELAAEGERTRIAREIHDGIAQMIYMLSLSLETAIDRVGGDAEEQRRRLRDLTALAKTALWEVRQYIFDLRPLLSGDAGLIGAVQGQVREFQAVADLPVELRISGDPKTIPLDTSAALYRIVQEGLGNIFRHARASNVTVEMAFGDRDVRLVIADDGIGIPETPAGDGRSGYGMTNLRQRVEALHGTIRVESGEGAGTRLEVCVPRGGDA
jgi:signal transduction histidine kinase